MHISNLELSPVSNGRCDSTFFSGIELYKLRTRVHANIWINYKAVLYKKTMSFPSNLTTSMCIMHLVRLKCLDVIHVGLYIQNYKSSC